VGICENMKMMHVLSNDHVIHQQHKQNV